MISFRSHVMAVERVERRLRLVTGALGAAGIPYAVVGGNAVAAWVGRVDPGATRVTKDVDLLVRRDDLDRVTSALERAGLRREDLRSLVIFIDPALVRMKLTSHRDIDRVHIADMLEVGLIDTAVRDALPGALRERLDGIERSQETE